MHLHDGFFFRVGLGGAPLIGSAKPKTTSGETSADADVSAFAPIGELSLGGTPTPGLVLGGASWGVPASGIEYHVKSINMTFKADSATISMIGPFVDFYPNPQQGFHVLGAITYTLVSASHGKYDSTLGGEYPPDDYSGDGVGLVLATGYEWWIGEQWSLGLLGRLQYTSVTLKSASKNYVDVDFTAWVPGVLVEVTYH